MEASHERAYQTAIGITPHAPSAHDALADGLSDEEYEHRWNKRRAMLQRARWPFGLKRGEYESLDLDVRFVPLRFVQKVA
jgi:hypothetical protein